MVTTWFIDTNVIASWVIVESNLLKVLSEKYHYPQEYQKLYSDKFKDDVNYINTLLNENHDKFKEKHEAFVSFLATNELFSAIRDEVLSLKLFNKGEPVSRWPGAKNRISLTKTESDIVYRTMMNVWDKLFSGNIEIITDYNGKKDTNYWEISSSYLFCVKNTKTQDVILLTTAIMNEADFFVTRDKHLIDGTKNILKENHNLEIMLPTTALLRYNDLNKISNTSH